MTLATTGTFPLTKRLVLLTKAGAYSGATMQDDGPPFIGGHYGHHSIHALAGVGLGLTLTPRVSLSAESEHFLGSDKNIMVSSGLRYRF